MKNNTEIFARFEMKMQTKETKQNKRKQIGREKKINQNEKRKMS
jgi:hypothetical protein